ncbi:MAG: tyrosine recombinase XerC [Clostridia bacterium]|nr:tyrosine recombinase XerC [Clostridia bacterium]
MNKSNYEDLPIIMQEYLFYISSIKNRSPQTIKEYYYDLRNIFRFLKRDKYNIKTDDLKEIDIKDIDINFIRTLKPNDFYNYLYYLTDEMKAKPVSRARKISTIKSFFNYLCNKEKLLDINPCVDLETPKLGKRIPKYLKLEEAHALLQSVDGKHKSRDYAILTLFLNCGLRLAELVNINLSHIRKDILTVIGKGDKERSIYLNKACMEAISSYLIDRPVDGVIDKDALFLSSRYKRIGRRTVEVIVKKHVIKAGLDPNKYSPHKLRHTAATLMYKHGKVDIRALQQILGHESISTTEIYTHVDNEEVRRALDKNPLNKL